MTNQAGKTLLVVDDLPDVREFYRDVAEMKGWTVIEAQDAESYEAAVTQSFDAVVLDLSMPSMTGIEILERLAEKNLSAPIMIASGQDENFLLMSMRLGRGLGLTMTTRLQKPITLPQFEAALDTLEDACVQQAKVGEIQS